MPQRDEEIPESKKYRAGGGFFWSALGCAVTITVWESFGAAVCGQALLNAFLDRSYLPGLPAVPLDQQATPYH